MLLHSPDQDRTVAASGFSTQGDILVSRKREDSHGSESFNLSINFSNTLSHEATDEKNDVANN